MSVPRLVSAQVRRLERLLDMAYKPGEIAGELGISVETFTRSYIPAGAPVMFDAKGKAWVNGKLFKEWAIAYLASRQSQPRRKMAEDEGYCFHCREVRKISKPKRKARGRVDVISGKCCQCGGRISRLGKGNQTSHQGPSLDKWENLKTTGKGS